MAEDINVGAISETLNNKADREFGNIPSNYDYVVTTYTSGTTWYRKYKSGWVEQGGNVNIASGKKTVVFPVAMVDTNYTILKTIETSSSSQPSSYNQFSFYNKTTTGATTETAGVGFSWQVSGMAA